MLFKKHLDYYRPKLVKVILGYFQLLLIISDNLP
jgi:hypothetical protein